MSYLENFKSMSSRKDLASFLEIDYTSFNSIIYGKTNEEKYNTFTIPKKNGGKRTIKAPILDLKNIQKKLSDALYICLNEIEEKRSKKIISFAFRKKINIVDNARNHKRKRYVLNIDIENFFDSFHFGRVRGFFLKDKNFLLNEEVATTIAQIACDGKSLPQGAPSSPVISELIGQIIDARLIKLAKKHSAQYSRYADDITFSSYKKTFSPALACQDTENLNQWYVGDELKNNIEKLGFDINPKKTRLHEYKSRQMVNGLVVNKKVNIKNEYYKNTRAMCSSLFKNGDFFIDKKCDEEKSKLSQLEGRINHIYQVKKSGSIKLNSKDKKGIDLLYEKFLLYKFFIDLKKPLIVTEGETDIIYLKESIKKLYSSFNELGSFENGHFDFSINFLRPNSASHNIIDISGGTGKIKNFIDKYMKVLESKKDKIYIKNQPLRHPVIILLDNDDGLKDISPFLKGKFSININTKTTDEFYYVGKNLYLIKTPEKSPFTGKEKTSIESFIPPEWKKKEINGKKFDPVAKNSTASYGKIILARHIKANSSKIDFSNFSQILSRITKSIEDYKTKNTSEP